MTMKRILAPVFLAALLVCTAGALSASAYDVPMATGNDWVNSTEKEKGAFLLGMATIIEIEQEVQGLEPEFAEHTLIDTWAKGLSSFTLTELRQRIDEYYTNHSDELGRPVIDVMWKEIAVKHAYQ